MKLMTRTTQLALVLSPWLCDMTQALPSNSDPLHDALLLGFSNEMAATLDIWSQAALGAEDMSEGAAAALTVIALEESANRLHELSVQAAALQNQGIAVAGKLQNSLIYLATSLEEAADGVASGAHSMTATGLGDFANYLEDSLDLAEATTFPLALRSAYLEGLAELRLVADAQWARILDIGRPMLLDDFLAFHQPGTDDIVDALLDPAPFAFPDFVPDAWRPEPRNWEGKWAPGTLLRDSIDDPLARSVLDEFKALGGAGMLTEYPAAATLNALGSAGQALGDAFAGLSAVLSNPQYQGMLSGFCDDECQSDAECGGCDVEQIGFGTLLLNPDEVGEAEALVGLLTRLSIKRGGVHLPAKSIGKAVKEAFAGLTAKVIAQRGVLYAHYSKWECVTKDCFLVFHEKECEQRSEWVAVSLPLLIAAKPWGSWSDSQWGTAMDSVHDGLDDWCDE